MQRLSRGILILLCLGCVAGCSIRQKALRETGEVVRAGIVALNTEPDPQLAREALPSNLKMMEVMLVSDPENPDLLFLLAQGYAAYAYLMIEDDIDLADAAGQLDRTKLLKQRAVGFYQRSLEFALQALGSSELRRGLTDPDLGVLRAAGTTLTREQVPNLFWLTFSLAGPINLDPSSPALIAQLPRVEILVQRLLELDSSYYHGLPLLLAGVVYGGRAPMFGGDLARARTYFEQGRAVSGGKFLLGPFLMARYLTVQAQDRTQFCEQLNAVADADPAVLPDQVLMNTVSRQWALRWRDRVGMLFEGGGPGCNPPPATSQPTEEDDGMLLQ